MNHLKTYPAHLALYLIAAVDFVAKVPALGPLAPYAPWITAAGAVGAALHHSYTTGAASAAVQTVSAAVAAAPAKLMLTALMLGATLSLAVGLTACATAPTAQEQAGVTVAVDVGTGLLISNNGKITDLATQKARAVEYKAIALKVKAVNDAGTATLATLADVLQPEIAKLPPADQLAAAAFVAGLSPILNQGIPGNPNVQNVQTRVDLILAAIIGTCEAYGA
jgi:hypothetical protein